MPILYKGDKSCTCHRDQEKLMIAAGWSYTKPAPVEKKTSAVKKAQAKE